MSRRDRGVLEKKTTLFVVGVSSRTRARDLAFEFERGYAFVEFEDTRDAEDAYHEMQNRRIDGYNLTIQWAKTAPHRGVRSDGSEGRPNSNYSSRKDDRRDRSPREDRSSRDKSIEGNGKLKRGDSPVRNRSLSAGREQSPKPKSRDRSRSIERRDSEKNHEHETLSRRRNSRSASPTASRSLRRSFSRSRSP
ncbi:hypothetical protein HK099_007487 [Clydaea vesicula]|uniref:RRM domain-containing protein n=1 Tax=Clydaea vesicula TaxID=447962 RepID=A0AAD5U6S8_9FUNG|nr:hypothetical protein HK099_007487 [Clydaea vesicula]